MREFIRSLLNPYRLEPVRRLLAKLGPEPPEDPYASVRHPRGRLPSGRTAAGAVEEPREPVRTNAIGRRR